MQPVTLRVPLLHWLASWTASRHGLKLAWETPAFTTSAAGVKLPSPCPLTQREWQNELRNREKDGSIVMPDALTRFQSMERSLTQPPGPGQSDTPQWLSILQGPTPADPENMLRELDALGCVPGPQVGQVAAAVAAVARPFGTSARVLQNLGTASVPAALVTAVKAVWTSCPASTQARMTADLQRLLDHVQQRHGSAVDGSRVRRTLEAVGKIIANAASLGYARWSQAGLAVASTDDLPISAFQHIGNVNDEQEFRKGMLALVRGLDRIAQHDVLLEATKKALTVTDGDSYQWFLGKGPTNAAPPPAAADASAPPKTRPPDGGPQQPHTLTPRPWVDQPPPASDTGPGRSPPTRVVRISGLRDLRAPEVSIGLSALFQTPVYLTPPDQQRGFGFAVIPAAVFESLYLDYPSRWYEFDGMWGVTLDSRRQTTGEAFHADLTALTVPPHLRPGPSPEQDLKRRRIDEGTQRQRPPTAWQRAAKGPPGPPPPLAPERPPPVWTARGPAHLPGCERSPSHADGAGTTLADPPPQMTAGAAHPPPHLHRRPRGPPGGPRPGRDPPQAVSSTPNHLAHCPGSRHPEYPAPVQYLHSLWHLGHDTARHHRQHGMPGMWLPGVSAGPRASAPHAGCTLRPRPGGSQPDASRGP